MILHVHRSVGFSILIYLHLEEGLLRRGRLIRKTLSNEALLTVLRRQINFDKDQNAATISKQLARSTGRSRSTVWSPLL
jgi:hypothetical protein